MKFNVKRILKGSLISLAVLGMIGGSLNIPNANARRRYRTHRVYRHRARRPIYRFGYWRHYRFHYYKTGYFRNGHWIRTVHKTSRRRYARHARRTHRRRTRTHYTHSRRIRRMNRRARRRVRRSRPRRTTRRKTYHFMGRTYYSRKAMANAILNDDLYDNPDGPVKKHVRRSHKRNNHVRANKITPKRAPKKHTASTQSATVQSNPNNYYGGTDSTTPSQATTNTTNESNNNGLGTDSEGFTIPKDNQWANIFSNQMKAQTLADINNDRQANGVAPLQESSELDQIAQMRTNPNQADSHKDPSTGVNYYAEDAPKLGYTNVPNETLGENIASSNLGNQVDDNGNVYETNKNGYDMANQEEDSLMNHDQASDNGHRQNILDPNYTKVGIGVGYNPSSTNFNLSEDFTGPSYNQSISQN